VNVKYMTASVESRKLRSDGVPLLHHTLGFFFLFLYFSPPSRSTMLSLLVCTPCQEGCLSLAVILMFCWCFEQFSLIHLTFTVQLNSDTTA